VDDLEREVARQHADPLHRADWLAALSRALRTAIADGDHQRFDLLLRRRPPHWYGSLVVPVLRALLHKHTFSGVLGLPNAGRLPGVSAQLVVEGHGSLDAPDHDALAGELVGDVVRLASSRQRAWEVLLHPTEETLRAYVAADPFSASARYSPDLLTWVVGEQ
jgi:hypothetical protein